MSIAIIGGGAAGFFAAITAAEANPQARIVIFERGRKVLEKVSISGGGRCNVTHDCPDPRLLVQHYPRGSRELLGPFMQFGTSHTVDWFAAKGVALKTEADGRMFPITDDSATIVHCLTSTAQSLGVIVQTSTRVVQFRPSGTRWQVSLADGAQEMFDKILIATGSNPAIWEMLQSLGHTLVSPVPSLFTFNTKDTRLRDLSGVSVVDAQIQVQDTKLSTQGPLLITHWGLSGPGILKLSAWGARALHEKNYHFPLRINWSGKKNYTEVTDLLNAHRADYPKRSIIGHSVEGVPIRLWQQLMAHARIPDTLRWADASKITVQSIATALTQTELSIAGKSTFKEEFVTAGGVALKEVNFKTFESRLHTNLFFAGEVLDIDAVTGGFNFQAAWTGGFIAGHAMVAV